MGKNVLVGIYIITNLINFKQYIGQSHNILGRWAGYRHGVRKGDKKNSSVIIYAMRKYGVEKFLFEYIKLPNNISQKHLDNLEQHFIFWHNSIVPNGYNLMTGGKGGKHTEKSKLKMSISRTGIPLSEEHRRNVGIAGLGKKRSKETRARMSAAALIAQNRPEQKLKISLANTGRIQKKKKLTDAHKANIKAAWADPTKFVARRKN